MASDSEAVQKLIDNPPAKFQEIREPAKIHSTAKFSNLSGEDGDKIFKIMGINRTKGKNSMVFDDAVNVTDDDAFIDNLEKAIEDYIDITIPAFEQKLHDNWNQK